MGSQRVRHNWATTWCDVMMGGSEWGETRGQRAVGTESNMAAKDKTPCRRRGAISQGPSSPSWCSATPATFILHIQVMLLPSELSHDIQHFCDARSDYTGGQTLPSLLFSSLPPLAQDIGQNIHLCFFPKCCGSTCMNYLLLKNTSKLPLFSCSAARKKMPIEWGKW